MVVAAGLELAGITLVLTGLGILLCAIAIVLIIHAMIVLVVSKIPVVGGKAEAWADSAATSATAHLWAWFHAGGQALATWVLLPIQRAGAVLGELRNAAADVANYVATVVSRALGVAYVAWSGLWQAASQAVMAALAPAIAYNGQQLRAQAQSITNVQAGAQQADDETRATLNARVSEINNAIAAQNAYTTQVKLYGETKVSQLRDALAPAIAYNGTQLVAQAASIVHVEGEARTWADGALTAAQGYADSVGSAATAAGIAGALTATQPLIQAVSTAFDTYKTDCGDPLCGGLLGAAKDLSVLEGLIGDGLLVALIMAAIADPQATAKVVEPVLVDIIDPILSGVKSAL